MGLLRRLAITAPILFRLDGGNDAKDTLKALNGHDGQFFIVKRNLRKELPQYWLSVGAHDIFVANIDMCF